MPRLKGGSILNKDLADALRVGITSVDMATAPDTTSVVYGTGSGIDYSRLNSPAGPWTTGRGNTVFDKKMIEKILNRPVTSNDSLAGKSVMKRTLKYKGITFIVNLEDEAMEFFEDPKNITREELQVLNVTYPEYYKRIESNWTDAYFKTQAKKVFESD